MLKDNRYLRPTYHQCEKNDFVRNTIIAAFDAVESHADQLEARIKELEKAAGRSSGMVR